MTGVEGVSRELNEELVLSIVFSSELLPLNEETLMSASLSVNSPRFSTSVSDIRWAAGGFNWSLATIIVTTAKEVIAVAVSVSLSLSIAMRSIDVGNCDI